MIWQGNIVAHGMTLSNDGNRAYVADPTGGDMLILDTSQIQARKAHPQAREISRLGWKTASIPQNAIPFTENGHPYVLEFDEYTAGTLNPTASRDIVGAARIIDIANEAAPRVVANLRLAVDQPAEHPAAGSDPGTLSPAQGYAAHYCNIPTRVNPKIVACSFIASGLRRVQHQRSPAPAGGRLLRRAHHAEHRDRLHRLGLRDVPAHLRRGPPRDLVHGRRHRLLRDQGGQLGLARCRRQSPCRRVAQPRAAGWPDAGSDRSASA